MENMKAQDLLKMIEELSNEEKQKFLDEIFYLYFNSKGLPRVETDWD